MGPERIRQTIRLAGLWLLVSVLLSGLAYWQAQRTVAQDLARQLQVELPSRLSLALQSRFGDDTVSDLVAEKLGKDLQSLPVDGPLNLVEQCQLHVLQLEAEQHRAAAGVISVPWSLGSEPRFVQLQLTCDFRWGWLLGSQSLLALMAILSIALLPHPMSINHRQRMRRLVEAGIAPGNARQRAAQLSDRAMAWFDCALRADDMDGEKALAAAVCEDSLVFDCRQRRVIVHGIPVALAKTPFFYFLWYARQRQYGDGWYRNPPVNRPDRDAAASLITLMEAHGGHNKSINDLKEHGLRAKTLDQNRNKIRDELITVLGEDLAAPYLFASERDLKSGRYRYRLLLDARQIEFIT
ncbi:hypothetical protein [Microbulbifer celer]|uniref:Uncharacterized protein n=1 Tax=Microbulbifer celer TaxID=435905 RepID=A0ABW3U7A7_9GAMM|nr:hypothetical protein [Microbulbifer celer]UFN57628.1 hypothetical protein LPW13_00860 [Microbulbifer celer]